MNAEAILAVCRTVVSALRDVDNAQFQLLKAAQALMPASTLADAEKATKRLSPLIKAGLPDGWGFALVVCRLSTHPEEGDQNPVTFITSINEEDVVGILRDTAAQIDAANKEAKA